MDDVLTLTAESASFDKERFINLNATGTHLDGGEGTFLETSFTLHTNKR